MDDDNVGNTFDNQVAQLYVLVVIHSIYCIIRICRILLG